jgi:hypothetical protein
MDVIDLIFETTSDTKKKNTLDQLAQNVDELIVQRVAKLNSCAVSALVAERVGDATRDAVAARAAIVEWLEQLAVVRREITGGGGDGNDADQTAAASLLEALRDAKARRAQRLRELETARANKALLESLAQLAKLLRAFDADVAACRFADAARVLIDAQNQATKLPATTVATFDTDGDVCKRAHDDVTRRSDALTHRLDDMFARMFFGGTLSERWSIESSIVIRIGSDRRFDASQLLDALAASADDALERRASELARRLCKHCVPRLLDGAVLLTRTQNALEFTSTATTSSSTATGTTAQKLDTIEAVYGNVELFLAYFLGTLERLTSDASIRERFASAVLRGVLPGVIDGIIAQRLRNAIPKTANGRLVADRVSVAFR